PLPVALGAAGQAAAGDGGIGGVDDHTGDGTGRRQGGADAIHQADEQALAAVGRLHGAPQSVVEELYRVGARDQAPQDALEVLGLLLGHDPNIGRPGLIPEPERRSRGRGRRTIRWETSNRMAKWV